MPPAARDDMSLPQLSAVDLLAAGKSDTETAAVLGLHRVSVTRWRLYSPGFRAALAERRAAVWGAAADRLRVLLPRAVDVLAEVLADPAAPNRTAVALAVLKLAGPLPLAPADPPDADEIVRQVVEREREELRDRDDDTDADLGLPGYAAHTAAVRTRFAQLAGPADPPHAGPSGDPAAPHPAGSTPRSGGEGVEKFRPPAPDRRGSRARAVKGFGQARESDPA